MCVFNRLFGKSQHTTTPAFNCSSKTVVCLSGCTPGVPHVSYRGGMFWHQIEKESSSLPGLIKLAPSHPRTVFTEVENSLKASWSGCAGEIRTGLPNAPSSLPLGQLRWDQLLWNSTFQQFQGPLRVPQDLSHALETESLKVPVSSYQSPRN